MPTVNLFTDYKQPLAKAFEYASKLAGLTSGEYKFTGVNTIVVTSIITEALNNYDRTAAAGRYGTTSEVADEQQVMVLQKDRGYSKSVDKGNYIEQNYVKTGCAVTRAIYNEQAGPEREKFILSEFIKNCGQYVKCSAAPTTSTIVGFLADCEVAFDDALVPTTDRYIGLANKYVAQLRQAFTECNDITDKMLLKNIVGMFGTLHVIGFPESYFPTDCYAVAWQKSCVVAPETIDDAKVSHDVPGISGMLCEGRFRYGAFVIGKRAKGVIALVKTASIQATPTITISSHSATITSSGADSIYYTTDGTDPRYSSTRALYSSAVATQAGMTVKAVAYDASAFTSEIGSATDA